MSFPSLVVTLHFFYTTPCLFTSSLIFFYIFYTFVSFVCDFLCPVVIYFYEFLLLCSFHSIIFAPLMRFFLFLRQFHLLLQLFPWNLCLWHLCQLCSFFFHTLCMICCVNFSTVWILLCLLLLECFNFSVICMSVFRIRCVNKKYPQSCNNEPFSPKQV